jgi:hypothetical protein
VRALAVRAEPVVPFLALGATIALMMIPYTDLRLASRPPRERIKEDARAAACLIAPDEELFVHGDQVGDLPGGMAYYLDHHLVFLGRDRPEKLRDLPPGTALLVPWRYRDDFAPRPGEARELEELPLDGVLEGYSSVRVINPLAREKDRVILLKKRS